MIRSITYVHVKMNIKDFASKTPLQVLPPTGLTSLASAISASLQLV